MPKLEGPKTWASLLHPTKHVMLLQNRPLTNHHMHGRDKEAYDCTISIKDLPNIILLWPLFSFYLCTLTDFKRPPFHPSLVLAPLRV